MTVALLAAGVTMTGCSNKDNNEPQEPAKVQTYKMSITASKGADEQANAPKKVLGLDGSTLTATWATDEEVTVYNETKGAALTGVLKPQTAGANTTLLGELTGTIAAGDVLTLKFLSPSYASQDGTLEYISANCDYATATTTVSSVDAGTIYTEGTANFANQQAIVKFTLMKKADNSAVEIPAATALTVSDGTNNYTVTPASATNVLFVAIPATNTVNLSTTIGAVTYSYDKTATDLLTAGQYYEIGVKMWREVNLAAISANTTLLNGDKATGTLSGNYKINVNTDGATVTLSNVTINGTNSDSYQWAGINCENNTTLVLEGTNTVTSFYEDYPGIHIAEGKTLTIQGSGTLNASTNGGTNGWGAGIGGSDLVNCGNIVIESGIINATGGIWMAGIGGGFDKGCGDITINGGIVTAQGGIGGAGIGAGFGNQHSASCGNITITDGNVTATGGKFAAGIGSGCGFGFNTSISTCGNITISGGTVIAIGGTNGIASDMPEPAYASFTNPLVGGAGIGTGSSTDSGTRKGSSSCGTITIGSGVTSVTATKGSGAENSIGLNNSTYNSGTCGTVTIEPGANVTQN